MVGITKKTRLRESLSDSGEEWSRSTPAGSGIRISSPSGGPRANKKDSHGKESLRRGGRDSNPRSRYSPDNHLAGGPNQPLWHLPNVNPLHLPDCPQSGGRGIRTHGGGNPTPVFKTGALSHSAIPPGGIFSHRLTILSYSRTPSKPSARRRARLDAIGYNPSKRHRPCPRPPGSGLNVGDLWN